MSPKNHAKYKTKSDRNGNIITYQGGIIQRKQHLVTLIVECFLLVITIFEYNEEDNGKGIEFERFYNTRAGITVYFNTSNYFDIHMTGLN